MAIDMRSRGVSSSSSSTTTRAAALALLLLLVLCFFSSFRCLAARPLPAATAAAPRSQQERNDGVNGEVVAVADGRLLLREDLTGNGDEVSELMEAAAVGEAAEACEEGHDEECVQRRLLRDAHLDYIYTQHKNKP
ncbi:phytosulfokines 2 [Oryza brachyantha]|uniref:Phytosulfokine n=1 Tax=Oryza brachyantha TaxID=4533 RepID=G2XMA0_ORYBR|nr:phytosulfokines 2 [Oryza brachyantha]CBX25318.1 hypothetical_protein [Oryza brachyantha]